MLSVNLVLGCNFTRKKVVCFDVLRCFLSVRSPNGKKAERKKEREKTADIEKTNMSAVR